MNLKFSSGLFALLFCLNLFAQSSKSNKAFISCVFLNADSMAIDNFKASFYNPVNKEQISIDESGVSLTKHVKYTLNVTAFGYYNYSAYYEFSTDSTIQVVLKENVTQHKNFTVKAINVREKSGFVFTTVKAKELAKQNLGQDFTYLIGNTASAISTSDAGNGVGYTGIRIRGSDATRINVTINGIPINDAESHGVFWVNMPDLASSTSNVQIQRGVGSSTVGTGAFGANINIQNTELESRPFVQFQQSAGSFKTFKSTMQFGTGTIGKLNFSGRLSKINSAGYIDRGSSDLQAFQFNLNYQSKDWNIQAVSFGGKEKTYQSWYGTPESRVDGNLEAMIAYADRNYLSEAERSNLLNSGRTYNYYTYENQTDNYQQNHYQLHISRRLNPYLFIKSSFFTTTGAGYYEEYKADATFASYGVSDFIKGNDTSSSTNLVRQRWLDNVFYGNFTSLNYKRKKFDTDLGLSVNQYEGKHFGEVIWADIAEPFGKDFRYYNSSSVKNELNGFIKTNYKQNRKLQFDGEVQVRKINYRSKGTDNDLLAINFDTSFLFINPKFGVVYELNKALRFYSSYSIGRREPVRGDFIDNQFGVRPKPENLQDFELGAIFKKKGRMLQFNFYNMQYKNQLVLTGELNDVGSSLRRNVDNSFRRGIELIWQQKIVNKLRLDANFNFSSNKIENFNDIYYNYDNGTVVNDVYKETDIAYSPSSIVFVALTDGHIKNMEMSVSAKHVGKQYLDNTLNNSRSIDAYTTFNFTIQKTVKMKGGTELILRGAVNNITGIFYSNNGYTYKYIYSGQLTTENFYYPQSPRTILFGIDLKCF
ncbi:MAG: TonB-dependent receptor [Bacteroidia bacterium]